MDASNKENVVAEGWCYAGEGFTNNIGEYFGLIKGLEFLVNEDIAAGSIRIQGDSELVINQMLGLYSVQSPHLTELYNAAKTLCGNLDCGDVYFSHIGRSLNGRADHLVGEAIQRETTNAYWVKKQTVYHIGYAKITSVPKPRY
jgi:ribonuclease HI